MILQPRQISKVVYEAIRAYEGTVGMADKGSWENTTQANRDEIMAKVDAQLRAQPHAPASIRPTDQMKTKILQGIVGAFVQVYNPPVVYQAPPVPEPPPPPIPVEKFDNPDAAVQSRGLDAANHIAGFRPELSGGSIPAPVETAGLPLITGEPVSVNEALAQADANIAEANK